MTTRHGRYDDGGNRLPDYATCGYCGRTWDDSITTSMTPAPSARCPFEYYHEKGPGGRPLNLVPDDYPVAVLCGECHETLPDRLRSGVNRCADCSGRWVKEYSA